MGVAVGVSSAFLTHFEHQPNALAMGPGGYRFGDYRRLGLPLKGTAEQWIKEGKYALNWTRLSCHRFVANQVRLWLFVLAYNLGNFMRRLTLPESVKHWSLRSVQTKLIKMGGRLVRHARRLVFQLAEVAVSREVFRQVLERIAGLHPAPG